MSGFRRRVELDRVPSDAKAELLVLSGDVQQMDNGGFATIEGSVRLEVAARPDDHAKLVKTKRGACVIFDASTKPLSCELEYRAEATVDQFHPLPPIDRSVARQELTVVPGFEAVRLPLTDQAMPTGLAWRPRRHAGRFVARRPRVAGPRHRRRRPGGPARAVQRRAGRAVRRGAPAARRSTSITKYGLLRLSDDDGDGQADRTELVADGWGHTLDYHDWAVGLPRDGAGNYYVSLALPAGRSQRSSRAGCAARSSSCCPATPTADDPRRYAIEPLAAGCGFRKGIALSPAGDLFVTDNQGNYTPFNELNHIVAGARYGFINRLESKRASNPPFRTGGRRDSASLDAQRQRDLLSRPRPRRPASAADAICSARWPATWSAASTTRGGWCG